MANWQCPEEWSDWSDWLGAGLQGRCRWRLAVLFSGLLFAGGRRTVSSWLRAAGVSDEFRAYYYFIGMLGRKVQPLAERLLVLILLRAALPQEVLAALDDTPTKRYGPKVQGAGIHHNPTPGPADQKFLYGHVWVTLALAVRHRWWGTIIHSGQGGNLHGTFFAGSGSISTGSNKNLTGAFYAANTLHFGAGNTLNFLLASNLPDQFSQTSNGDLTPIPEPTGLAVWGLAMLGGVGYNWRRRCLSSRRTTV